MGPTARLANPVTSGAEVKRAAWTISRARVFSAHLPSRRPVPLVVRPRQCFPLAVESEREETEVRPEVQVGRGRNLSPYSPPPPASLS